MYVVKRFYPGKKFQSNFRSVFSNCIIDSFDVKCPMHVFLFVGFIKFIEIDKAEQNYIEFLEENLVYFFGKDIFCWIKMTTGINNW